MRESVEQATRALALSTALVLSAGAPATAKVVEKPAATAKAHNTAPKPSIRQVASKIKTILRSGNVEQARGGPGQVAFEQALPGGLVAEVSLKSALSDKAGLPDLNTLEDVEVSVNEPQDPIKPYTSPVERVSFTRLANGSWNAYQTRAYAGSFPDFTHHTDVIGRDDGHKYVKQYDTIVVANSIQTSPAHITGAAHTARQTVTNFEIEAGAMLQAVVIAQADKNNRV